MAEGISARELKEKIDADEEIVIIDVRSKPEFESGHIDNALWIPLNQLTLIEGEDIPKESEFYVVCRSGARSSFAVNMLHRMGYQGAINVVDGMLGWNEL